MADVSYLLRRAQLPNVERVLRGLETKCRHHDRGITRVIGVVTAVVVWMVIADSLVSTTTVMYDGTWDFSVRAETVQSTDRSSSRTLHRVIRTMSDQCNEDDFRQGTVIAPQVHVNGKPYMHRIMRLCEPGLEFINPVVAFRGEKTGVCVDEHMGSKRRSSRRYPIAVHSVGQSPHSFLELAEVCTFMHALSLLDAQWSV